MKLIIFQEGQLGLVKLDIVDPGLEPNGHVKIPLLDLEGYHPFINRTESVQYHPLYRPFLRHKTSAKYACVS